MLLSRIPVVTLVRRRSVGVVGGGIIGLATAEAVLQDYPQVNITVYSEKFTPHTTGDVAAGLFKPYLYGKNDEKKMVKWFNSTLQHVLEYTNDCDEDTAVISPISGYKFWKENPTKVDDIFLTQCCLGWRLVDQREIEKVTSNKYSCGVFFTTWLCDCSRYLPCVMKKLELKGVKFIETKVHSLHEVANRGHDIVIHTTGFNAKFLTNDTSIYPARTQALNVSAPWIRHFYIEMDGDSYIVPKIDCVVVGGTDDEEPSLAIDPRMGKNIWKEACDMLPSLTAGTVIRDVVGIRPARSTVRMEIERARTPLGKEYVILHHYGHGGSGVAVHWGSALDASALLKPLLDGSKKTKPQLLPVL